MDREENLLKGILGALIGSLAGVLVIVVFGKLGYVVSFAGLIMAAATIKLYEKFAGSISKKGIIACIIIMIIMTFIGNNLSFSIILVDELKRYNIDADVIDIFFRLFSLLQDGSASVSSYFSNLFMVLLFSILGSYGLLKEKFKILKNKGEENEANKIEE